jgi:tripartite-type tricarboxylate transporter receptor subunit TctC
LDATARILAKYLGRYIPGEPNVIVENMPGAGSLTAANHLYNLAPSDGLTIGTFVEGQLIGQLVGEEGVQFDGRRFGWLGSALRETLACILRTDSPYTTVDALKRQDLPPVIVGSIPGTNLEHFPKMLNATLGMNFRVVSDYSGTAPIRLATDSGEVQGMCGGYEPILATAADWVDANFVRIPIYQSDERDMRLEERYPEAVRAEDLTDDAQAKQLLRTLTAPNAISKFFVAPPGVPPERLKALQDAFWAAVQDENLHADAEQAGLEFNPKPAARVMEIVNELLNTPLDVVERLKEIREA